MAGQSQLPNRVNMKAIILAGGLGTRLRPTTLTLPKQLIRIAGKYIIEYSIEKIRKAGFEDVGIVVSPSTKTLYENKLSHLPNLNFIVQDAPKGLAHAVYAAKGFLGPNDSFLTFLGDNVFETEFPQIDEFKEDFAAKIILKSVEDPRSLGVAVVESSKVILLIEKPEVPPSNLGVCGMYLFTPEIWGAIESLKLSVRGEYEITDAISSLISTVRGVHYKMIDGFWYDAGSLSDLLKANHALVKQESVKIVNGSHIFKSSIGENVDLRDCYITNSIILDGSRITYAEIKDSLIGENVQIKSSIRLTESHIGSYTTIGV